MKYDIVTLDGEDYIINSEVTINGYTYLYVISMNDENNFSILRRTIKDGNAYLESLTDDEEIEMVFEEIAKRNE